jgi:1-acyl-sn-glycerol-3-phosphate acyltransferase
LTARQLGASYRFAVAVFRPPLMVLTKRDWQGAEQLPREGGFVAVTNHISYADPLTFGHFLYDNGAPPRYLAKEKMFRLPLAGRIIAGAGQIPVYRETADAARALAAAVRAVEKGECVGIYPEATLTRDPDLWPMVGKTGAARIALTTGCPVIPVAQWGAQEILAPYGKRLRLLPRTTIHVHAGPPVDLSAYSERTLDAPTLRAATEDIMAAITVLLEGIRGERAPTVRWDPRDHDLPRIGNPRRRNGIRRRGPRVNDSGASDSAANDKRGNGGRERA